MASNVTIGLIAGGAVIGGATLGGAAQVLVAWRQRYHERMERRRTLKLETYRDLLHYFAGLSELINEATPLDDSAQASLLRKWSREYDLLRADVSFVGTPQVRAASDDVQEAFGQMAEASNAHAAATAKMEPSERGSVYEHTRTQFETFVWPAIKQLADAMAKDIDLR